MIRARNWRVKIMRKLLIGGLFLIVAAAQANADEAWQRAITWSANDGGVVECPQEFIDNDLYVCLPGGVDMISRYGQGRACAISKAILNAKTEFCQVAFRQALATQCHNRDERDLIEQAGQQQVCEYLKRF